jgi:hypothetical protein
MTVQFEDDEFADLTTLKTPKIIAIKSQAGQDFQMKRSLISFIFLFRNFLSNRLDKE